MLEGEDLGEAADAAAAGKRGGSVSGAKWETGEKGTYMTAMLILRGGWAAMLIVDCKPSEDGVFKSNLK